uniref:Uncharacterized protein n=1 Tax=Hyaloperonospora arabidopsidis (strain Emoy2) TaxID=559515 RepID=M4B810_HYAAE
MQAWSTPEGRSDRIEQAKQMRHFVDAIGILHHEPLILARDFNVDSQNFGDELAQLLILLSAHEPHRIGKQNFTSECVMCYFVAMFLCGLIILGPRTVKLIAHTRMSWLGATELRTVTSVLRNMFAIGARQR